MNKRFCIAIAFACMLLFAAGSAEAVTYCNEQQPCPEGSNCVDNRCVLDSESVSAPVDPSAREECGADRRCRIRRLARKNRARRRIEMLREERRLQDMVAEQQRKRDEAIVRKTDPWNIDFTMTAAWAPGFTAGYSLVPSVKLEASIYTPNLYISEEVGPQYVEGYHDFTSYSLGATYFFSESVFAPYVRGAVTYNSGQFDNFEFGERLETEAHALTVAAGLDMQFDFGFHVRLGPVYRFLIFNEASVSLGQYDDAARQGLEQAFADFDIEFAIGWAF